MPAAVKIAGDFADGLMQLPERFAIGFGAGALVGAAVAGGAYPGYYGYDDGAGYAYAPGPYETYGEDSYAYAPGPNSYAYAPGRYTGYRLHQGRSCGQSPASINYTSCD